MKDDNRSVQFTFEKEEGELKKNQIENLTDFSFFSDSFYLYEMRVGLPLSNRLLLFFFFCLRLQFWTGRPRSPPRPYKVSSTS